MFVAALTTLAAFCRYIASLALLSALAALAALLQAAHLPTLVVRTLNDEFRYEEIGSGA
jgi:hypothetical protein